MKSSQFFVAVRRLSVLYFFVVFTAFILVAYYYYLIPGQKNEFAERSLRTLKTVTSDLNQEITSLSNTFIDTTLGKKSANFQNFKNHTESYKLLYENIPYEIDTTQRDSEVVSLKNKNGWKFIFSLRDSQGIVKVPVQGFVDRLLTSRNDLFNSYVLLTPVDFNPVKPLTKIYSWNIVYKQNDNSSSDLLFLDTLQSSFKNSDMSGMIELTIDGKKQEVFLHPFNLHNQEIIFGGVISKVQYDHYIHTIPVNYIVDIVIAIVLLLIILPLLKIYFLSSNETIFARDVGSSMISVFLGTAAILLIILFIYLYKISSASFENRMQAIGKEIKTDIDTQLDSASVQLNYYITAYDSLPPNLKKGLAYAKMTDSETKELDSILNPRTFPDLTRLVWIDSAGESLAKWSPYSFKTALTSVKQYQFFKSLKTLYDNNDSNKVIVYSGKSNTTGEFQIYVAKQHVQQILDSNGMRSKKAIGVLLATSLHCNTAPVMPPGFSFCLVDNSGEVILHSDQARNLSENLFAESDYHSGLMSSVRQKANTLVKNVTLYGINHDLVVEPIKGHSLSLVIFFPTQKVISNISRFLHFSIASLLYVFIIIGLFVLYFTYRTAEPSKLKFRLEKEHWIRPSASNEYSYYFAHRYFLSLIGIHFLAVVLIQLLRGDFRNIFYLSFILPFYAILGLITANKKLVNQGKIKDLSLRSYGSQKIEQLQNANKASNLLGFFYNQLTSPFVIPVILILIFNIYILTSLNAGNGNSFLVFILLQLFFAIALFTWYFISLRKLNKSIEGREKLDRGKVANRYVWSLYFIVILIAVLPSFGITTYAFFAEKTQYKKSKELMLALQQERKNHFLHTTYRSNYKTNLLNKDTLSFSNLYAQGIYLSDHDTIEVLDSMKKYHSSTIYDEPYRAIINHLYSYTNPYFGEFAIADRANDSSWYFTSSKDSLSLYYENYAGSSIPFRVSSFYPNPLRNFLSNGGIIFPITILFFLIFLFWFLKSLIERLFLLNFSEDIHPDKNFLNDFLMKVETDPLYSHGHTGAEPITTEFFKKEEKTYDQDYILKMSFCFAPVYERIWSKLSEKEKFILYDLSRDGYTNYKNVDVIYQLLSKGILKYQDYKLHFFSYSFRNFVGSQNETEAMQKIISKYAVGGVWKALRVPVLLIAGIIGVFFFLTQSEIAHDLTAFITSLITLVPLLLQLIGNTSKKSSE